MMVNIAAAPTEDLETELKALSNSITSDRDKVTNDQARFQSITAELKNRRETKDEQPPPTIAPATNEEALARENDRLRRNCEQLVLKIISMESEQAKLVVDAEVAKALQRDTEEKLALVVKYLKQPQPEQNS